MDVTVTINGQEHTHDVEPRTLLVHYIREHVGLTGTNIGCDTSSCGACSIHFNGEAVKSCTHLAVQADGQDVRTIEGMAADDGTLHPMQQAFMENHGLQCGYCTPGMVMAATSLLDENANPTEEEVRIGLEGNLCRCTGYHNIVKSVLAAQADGMEVTTIEGMAAADGTLHPMQQAFMENHGLQCGYCTPGMVMAATSLLDENPSPTEDEVRIGLEGNLCRCTGYHNIVKSVLAAADA